MDPQQELEAIMARARPRRRRLFTHPVNVALLILAAFIWGDNFGYDRGMDDMRARIYGPEGEAAPARFQSNRSRVNDFQTADLPEIELVYQPRNDI